MAVAAFAASDGDGSIWARDTELKRLVHDSEDVLAEVVCGRLGHVAAPRILIGGLGMGYTLAAALRSLGPNASVVVAELVSAVVDWNRGPLGPLAGHPLNDKRVTVRVQDIALSLQVELGAFDGILLDIDNGPEGLTRDSNDWLYSEEGLASAYTALRHGGILAVWSSTPKRDFTMRLRKAGFDAEEVVVAAPGGRKAEAHTIFLAVNRG